MQIKHYLKTDFIISTTLNGKQKAFFNGLLLSQGTPNKYRAFKFVDKSDKVMIARYRNFWQYELTESIKGFSESDESLRQSVIKGLIEALENLLK